MTFSLVGRCARTGQLGAAVTTSSMAVGSRVPYVRARVGAVLTQHRTDPRLGPRGLDLLASGCDAREAIDALVASTRDIGWRQIAAIDAAGHTAAFSGRHVKPHLGEVEGHDCVAIGNIVANERVVPAVAAAFESRPEQKLAERLIAALEAGLAAGGEFLPLRSAAVLVAAEHSFPYVDLRVDASAEPLRALRALWEEYAPLADEYVVRGIEPDRAQGAS